MAIKLNVYKKGESSPVGSGSDITGVTITGLTAGAVVVKGEYEATHTDDTNVLKESERVPVPGFTVKQAGA